MILTRDKKFYSSLIGLALPIIIQNIISLGVTLADGVMSARLGDTAVVGVYAGGQVVNLLTVLLGGVDGTVLLLGARHYGAGNTAGIRRVLGVALVFSSALAALFTLASALAPNFTVNIFAGRGKSGIPRGDTAADAAEYLLILAASFIPYALSHTVIAALRSAESARVGMYISLAGLAVKLALNFVMMPTAQIKGAAIATVVSRLAELIFALFYLLLLDRKTGLNFRQIIGRKKYGNKEHKCGKIKGAFGEFVKYGLLIMGSQAVWAVNNLGGGAILGAVNNEASIAAVGIASTFNTVGFAIINGTAVAVGIIISKLTGEGDREHGESKSDGKYRIESIKSSFCFSGEKISEYARSAQIIAVVLGVAIAITMFLLKGAYLLLYDVSEEAKSEAVRLLSLLSLTAAFTSYQSVTLLGVIKGSGRVFFTFITDAVSVLLIVLPSSFIAYRLGAPIDIIYILLRADQFLKCIPAALKANLKKTA